MKIVREKDWTTHAEFAKTNKDFQTACERAGVQPTKRQAAKFRRKEGRAYANRNETVQS